MEREYSSDQVETGISQFLSLSAAALAAACEWILEAGRGQLFLADGSPNLVQWVSARFGLRHSTAAQLVRVARRLQDLPLLRDRFADGALCVWIRWIRFPSWPLPRPEEAVISECLGLSNAALDRAARRANPPSALTMRSKPGGSGGSRSNTPWTGSEVSMNADLPGMEMSLVESAIREKGRPDPTQP